MRADLDSGEWQDWLVDDSPDQEEELIERDEMDHRRAFLESALETLNERERRIFEARRLSDEPMTLEDLSAEFGVSREQSDRSVRAFEGAEGGSAAKSAKSAAAAAAGRLNPGASA